MDEARGQGSNVTSGPRRTIIPGNVASTGTAMVDRMTANTAGTFPDLLHGRVPPDTLLLGNHMRAQPQEPLPRKSVCSPVVKECLSNQLTTTTQRTCRLKIFGPNSHIGLLPGGPYQSFSRATYKSMS